MKLSSALVLLLPAFVSAMNLPEEGLVARARNQNNGNNAAQAVAAKASQAAANNAAASAAAANQAKQSAAAAAASAAATTTSAAAASTTSASSSGSGGNESAQAAQSSLTLLQSQVSTGFANNGQDVPTAGQVASLTTTNNYINFCALFPNLPLTNGQQVTTGSCNNAIMGVIPASDKIPSGKFVSPPNLGTIAANTAFTITMQVSNIQLGQFTNAKENYYSAPQQVNSAGVISGHTHFVVEELPNGLGTTTPLNPLDFSFFQGVDGAQDANGQVSVSVSDGLPAGVYRIGSIMSSSNHQPALAPIAQHGLMDDVIYITVSDNGAASSGSASNTTAATGAATGATSGAATGSASSASAAAAAASSAAASKGANNAAGSATAASQSAAAAQSSAAATAKGANNGKAAQGKNGAQQGRKARRSFFDISDY